MTQVKIRKHHDGPVEFEADLDDEALNRILSDLLKGPRSISTVSGIVEVKARPRKNGTTRTTPRLSEDQAERLKGRVPTAEEVAEFIRSKPDRAHSLKEVSEHFLGVHVNGNSPSRAEKQLFWQIQDRASSARSLIERGDKSGRFVSDNIRRVGHSRVYSWRRPE